MVTPSPVQVRPRARRRWILVWVLAVTVVGLLGYFVVAPQVQIAALNAAMSTEIPAAREAALPTAGTAHREWLKRVSAALGLGRGAVYSATYDVCYVNHDDGGLIVQSYNKKCLLAYVDFYELPARNSAVDTAITNAKSSTFGPQSSGMVFVPDYLTAAGRKSKGAGIPSDMPNTIRATLPGTSDARAATDIPMITSPVVAYAAHDAFAGRALLEEEGQTTLDPTKQYLVVHEAHPYYTRVLGCAIGRLLFCFSPLGSD